MQNPVDYIIIGQGLAGTLLAWFLEQAGKTFSVIDSQPESSSSAIAAGIVHPVTGRRLVKSWRADELIPFAEHTYRAIEEKCNVQIYFQKPILEIYTSVKHRNDWHSRSSESGMENYCGNELLPDSISGIAMPFGGITIKQSGFLMSSDLLSVWNNHLIKTNRFIRDQFNFDDFESNDQCVKWKNIRASHIIFCEGHTAKVNPYFSFLPFNPAKGEIITIEALNLPENYILNRALYVLPLGNHLFKVGATHEWNTLNSTPTTEARYKLEKLLSEIINVPYSITEHHAAIRPTVIDRRPFLGTHPENERIHIFNGLGTKGVMLAPFFANQLCKALTEQLPIDPEADIRRFSGK